MVERDQDVVFFVVDALSVLDDVDGFAVAVEDVLAVVEVVPAVWGGATLRSVSRLPRAVPNSWFRGVEPVDGAVPATELLPVVEADELVLAVVEEVLAGEVDAAAVDPVAAVPVPDVLAVPLPTALPTADPEPAVEVPLVEGLLVDEAAVEEPLPGFELAAAVVPVVTGLPSKSS